MTRHHKKFNERVESNSMVKQSEVCKFLNVQPPLKNDLLDEQLNGTLLFSYFIGWQSSF